GAPAWGLVAAELGNKDNCSKFVSRFWYGVPADQTKKSGDEGPGFLDWLKAEERASRAADWTNAVAAFRAATAEEQRLREARQAAHEAVCRLPGLEQDLAAARRELAAAIADRDRADAAARAAGESAATARTAAQTALERRREHRSAKPGGWEILFTLRPAIPRLPTQDGPPPAAG